MPVQAPRPPASTDPILVLNAHFLPSSHDWRSGRDDGRDPYRLDTYLHQARVAAEAGFDILFQAYFSGVNRGRVRAGPWSPPFEPFQLAAVTAAAVKGITLMPTLSTLHTHPFTAARQLASLDRISRGRAAVNLVSSFRSGTALGARRTIDPSRRHAQTEEYLALLRALWASWPPDALVPDRAGGRFVRDDAIRDLGHEGDFYEQDGPLDLPPYSASFPPLMMAAGSLGGLQLAVRGGDYVFAAAPTLPAAQRLRRALHAEARAAGRDPDAVKLVLGANLQIAGAKEASTPVAPSDAALAALARGLAQDIPALGLEALSLDDSLPVLFPYDAEETLRRFGFRASGFWEQAACPSQSLRGFLAAVAAQGEHAVFRGPAAGIAETMRRWIEEGGTDGFQFIQGNDFAALCGTIVPVLRGARRSVEGMMFSGDLLHA
ncbi:LLM class flavin-dependent oxidoreductase [Methylobacterium organophilum]|uniref:LLM class flavin-dependent oxidoreductase n=1 Tax=Methylobacterium organophilum TaxID=410 RepID=UPI001F12E528|nr:LLM class flavin-dependent oxidoreductase [Methylobacterium organophilum]UMY18329.1 LLM class flavin-dependent oxidoreductase [Methylobacterium organophilum]